MKLTTVQKNYIQAAAISAGMIIPTAFLIVMSVIQHKSAKYVITAKGANKIEYYSLKNPAETHVMVFDGDTALTQGGWYPYLNVGDTIIGPAYILDEPVARSTYYYGMRPPILTTTIEQKNGKRLTQWREIARRDSILRTMRQKQK